VGHVAVKHIVYLELVEREWKRQKQEKELGMCLLTCMNGCLFYASSHVLVAEKIARGTGNDAASKGGEVLDQVAGNAEDEIGGLHRSRAQDGALVRSQFAPRTIWASTGPYMRSPRPIQGS
jgi:hypothetical protein